MNWILGDWIRILVVTGLVGATTGYVWVKVQISETAMGVVQARRASEVLREERSKLQAAVDLVQRPGIVRERALRELNMIDPTALTTTELIIGGGSSWPIPRGSHCGRLPRAGYGGCCSVALLCGWRWQHASCRCRVSTMTCTHNEPEFSTSARSP